MPMYNLIDYSNNHSKAYGTLWQYYGDKPSLNNDGNIVDFTGANFNSNLCKYKQKSRSNGQQWHKKC